MRIQQKDCITLYGGQSTTVVRQEVQFKNGNVLPFEFVERPPVALIIPLIGPTEILMIEQYRAAVNEMVWEFPAGKKNENENILDTANRELEEETGYKAGHIVQIAKFYTTPHFSNEIVYVFLATELEYTSPEFQDHEFIKVSKKNLIEIKQLLATAKINDAKSLLAVSYYINTNY